MLLNFRLVATGLIALAACTRALDPSSFTKSNFTNSITGCGTPSLQQELWTHTEQSLEQWPNTTKREERQMYRIPTYITVLVKNNTVEGGNLHDSQIQLALDSFNKFYSYGFVLDTSVDTTHRYARPDLFDANSGYFNGSFYDIQRQYHRGAHDYASLNIIFLYRLGDEYRIEERTIQEPDGQTWNATIYHFGGVVGESSVPQSDIWENSDAQDHEKMDGMFLSSAIVPDVGYPGHSGSLNTFPHEFGHWVGLHHTDHSRYRDTAGKIICDDVNDGVDDTPTHILEDGWAQIMQSCPPEGKVNTCQHLDKRPDPIHNLMVSHKSGGCDMENLTDGQRRRTLAIFKKYRMPYKQRMQQKGLWVQPQDQQPQDQRPEDQQPQDQQPEDQQPEDQQPEDQRPEDQRPEDQQPEGQQPEGQRPEDQQPQDQQPEDQQPEDQRPEDQQPEGQRPEDQQPEDQRPEDQQPEGQQPEDQQPEDQRPEDQQPEGQQPEDQQPEDQRPEDQQPEDQQPQGQQDDWLQQQIARLRSESNSAWKKFRQQRANYRQQLVQNSQRNLNSCLNQVQKGYEREKINLDKWTQDAYKQLQDNRRSVWSSLKGYWKDPQNREWAKQEWTRQENDIWQGWKDHKEKEREYREAMERDFPQNQKGCRQKAQEGKARSLQDLETWAQRNIKVLQGNDRRMQEYLDRLKEQQRQP